MLERFEQFDDRGRSQIVSPIQQPTAGMGETQTVQEPEVHVVRAGNHFFFEDPSRFQKHGEKKPQHDVRFGVTDRGPNVGFQDLRQVGVVFGGTIPGRITIETKPCLSPESPASPEPPSTETA